MGIQYVSFLSCPAGFYVAFLHSVVIVSGVAL